MHYIQSIILTYSSKNNLLEKKRLYIHVEDACVYYSLLEDRTFDQAFNVCTTVY